VKELKSPTSDVNELLIQYYAVENETLKTELQHLYSLWTMRVFFKLTKNKFIRFSGNCTKYFANLVYEFTRKTRKVIFLENEKKVDLKDLYNQILARNFDQIYILIGHEASATGAPVVLMELARQLAKKNGVLVFLNKGGLLEKEYISNFSTKILTNSELSRDEQKDFLEFMNELSKKEINFTLLLNTVAQNFWVDFLINNGINYSTWIHELNTSWNFWPDTFDKQIVNSKKIIADSEIIKIQLQTKFGSDLNVDYIKNGDSFEIKSSLEELKSYLHIGKEKLIVLAGTRSIRKGFDLLPNLGKILKQRNQIVDGFKILWIGESMHPELDMFINDDIKRLKLGNNIEIMSTTNNYADYVNACDVFVHLSREDSAPQVLELAKQLGKPIALFEGIGGRTLQDQETSLRVSKFLDLDNLANEIEGVINHPLKYKEVGSYSSWPDQSQLITKALENPGKINAPSGVINQSLNAKSNVKSNVSLRFIDTSAISVIIPNYNHEQFIEERLHSILNQSRKPAEIIVLDDGSKDNSFQIACDKIKTTTIENKIVANQFNSGNILRQWEKGILNSKSDWVWIAESDDSAALDLIESAEDLISRCNSDLILFESEIIDEESSTMFENSHFNRIHVPTILNTTPPGESLTVEMRQLKRDGFLIRNLFVNVSAIIWRKSYLLEALTKTLQQDPPILVGDWCLYLNIDDKCKVTYCDRSLNQFRRSRLSVRNKSDLDGSLISSRNFVKNTHFGLYTNEDLIRFEIENLRIAHLND